MFKFISSQNSHWHCRSLPSVGLRRISDCPVNDDIRLSAHSFVSFSCSKTMSNIQKVLFFSSGTLFETEEIKYLVGEYEEMMTPRKR